MKVAYLINQYPKVSHSFIRREILAVERRGIEVTRIAVRGWDGELVDAEDVLERERTRYVLKDGLLVLSGAVIRMVLQHPGRFLSALKLALKMSRKAERAWPYHLMYLVEACRIAFWLEASNAVHLHAHFGTNPAEVAMLVHVLSEIPYSFTVHGSEEFDKPAFIGLSEKIRRAAFVVAISSFGRSQLFRLIDHTHWPKVKLVHCGLEQAFHDVPHVPVPERLRLVSVGRLCEQKGQLLLIEAAAALVHAGFDFELVLAGDGELRTPIEKRIAEFRLQRHVRITGWISSAQVREEILAARALVLPSFAEGLPVVIMEAMALRRPILTTYVAGIPELVVPNENGWLFPAGDIEKLIAAMKACLQTSSAELDAMGVRARAKVLLEHDIDCEAKRLAGFFRDAALETEPPLQEVQGAMR